MSGYNNNQYSSYGGNPYGNDGDAQPAGYGSGGGYGSNPYGSENPYGADYAVIPEEHQQALRVF